MGNGGPPSFPVLEHGIFFNHAAVAPAARAVGPCHAGRYAEEATREGGWAWPKWGRAAQAVPGCRSGPARRRRERDRSDAQHDPRAPVCGELPAVAGRATISSRLRMNSPANAYPWRNLGDRGVALRVAPEPEDHRYRAEDFLPLIDSRTRLVSVSLVQYSTGYRMPVEGLAEACRARGILFCLDAIQAVGAMPVKPAQLGCDFLAADGHKWMLGPEGCGLFFVSREVMDRLGPVNGRVARACTAQ